MDDKKYLDGIWEINLTLGVMIREREVIPGYDIITIEENLARALVLAGFESCPRLEIYCGEIHPYPYLRHAHSIIQICKDPRSGDTFYHVLEPDKI